MEEKLTPLVTRIQNSTISDEEKAKLYAMISEALDASVLPVLLKHMPKDQLEDLGNNPGKVTVESYAKLLKDTIQGGETLKEAENAVDQILTDFDTALQEEG